MSNRIQTHVPAVDLGTASHLPYAVQAAEPTRTRAEQPVTDGAREHVDPTDDNAEYLPELTRECERHGLTLSLTQDPAVDLPEIKVIDGARTFLARSDELGVALDDLRHGGSCNVYPGLCMSIDGENGDETDEHGRHFDHGGRPYSVPGMGDPGDPEIWAAFIHLSGGVPHVGFMGQSLNPDETRKKAAQLRLMAAEMDQLADQVEAAEKAHAADITSFIRGRQAAAHGPLAEALGAMADLVEKTGDPDGVAEFVIHLTDRKRAEASA